MGFMREQILDALNKRPNTADGLMYKFGLHSLQKRQRMNDDLVQLAKDKLIFHVRVGNKSVFMTYAWCKAKHREVA